MSGGGSNGPQETELDKELAAIGVSRQADYLKVMAPKENYAINKVVNQQAASQQQGLGISKANYEQQFDANRPQMMAGLGQRQTGGGGALLGTLGKYSLNQGMATGQGQVSSQLGSQRSYGSNLQNLVDIGQGKAGNAQQGFSNAAGVSADQATIDARAAAAASNGLASTVGTGAGLVAGTYGGYNPGFRG